VTESEWLACTDPREMLEALQAGGLLPERKARLFAVACCRRIWPLLTYERSRRAVEVAERYADGAATDAERLLGGDAAFEAEREILTTKGATKSADMAAGAACYPTAADEEFLSPPEGVEFTAPWGAAFCAARSVAYDVPRFQRRAVWTRLQEQAREEEHAAQAVVLRDLFGNPFRPLPPLAPSLLNWHGGIILKLAQAAYDHRDLPSGHLDPARLAVLADALEEAGCTSPDLLNHCRRPGVHVRGCWVIDLLLGKV
jgi:hypothetical protein